MSEPLRIPARHDAYPLSGELFLPPGEPRAAVLIGSAMAVRKGFYARFAQHLADRGLAALTVDYRGIGGSRPHGSLRGFAARFHEWGERDLAGAADFLLQRFPRAPLAYVGHSAGAQLMGMLDGAPIRAALFASAGTAYWRAYRGRARAFMAAFFHAIVPVSVAVRGFLPMRAFGQGDDVPAGVALEWAKWGRHPQYAASHVGGEYTKYHNPLRALSIEDDNYAPRTAVEGLLALYPAARKELLTVPGPLGHFGFFRRPEAWEPHVEWLLEKSHG
ncbi:MAG TPA: alpha/beta fold hydrolase [Myxococcales bacterium]|nr:alpha/beta fold hydrolase [Myxococcales bacterium]